MNVFLRKSPTKLTHEYPVGLSELQLPPGAPDICLGRVLFGQRAEARRKWQLTRSCFFFHCCSPVFAKSDQWSSNSQNHAFPPLASSLCTGVEHLCDQNERRLCCGRRSHADGGVSRGVQEHPGARTWRDRYQGSSLSFCEAKNYSQPFRLSKSTPVYQTL